MKERIVKLERPDALHEGIKDEGLAGGGGGHTSEGETT